MSTTQRVAQLFGIVFILVGVLGFPMGSMTMETGNLLGYFPVNLVHNVVHILFGVWGLLAARSFAGAKQYCTIGGVIYLVLAVLGVVMPTGFGLVPLGGYDVYLHAVLGLALVAAGFTAKSGSPATAAA